MKAENRPVAFYQFVKSYPQRKLVYSSAVVFMVNIRILITLTDFCAVYMSCFTVLLGTGLDITVPAKVKTSIRSSLVNANKILTNVYVSA